MSAASWVRRHALALWFLVLGALGVLRFWMKWREAADASLATDALLWLAGGVVCGLVGIVLALRRTR